MGGTDQTVQVGFEAARLALIRAFSGSENARGDATAHACRILAQALEVERLSVWIFSEARDRLRCECIYVRSKDTFLPGAELVTERFPKYCRALEERIAIVVDDVYTHPLTAELVDIYLRPLGITSMLDASIHRSGQVFGVVCHEHVGPRREWTQAEVEFASAVAEMVAMVYEQDERAQLEAKLRTQAARMAGLEQLQQLRSLTRAVAHDFNNVMSGVVRETLALKQQGHPESAEAISRCIEVGVGLLRELANFGRELEAGSANPAAVLEALRLPLEMLVRDKALLTIAVAPPPEGPSARVPLRPIEVEQLLLNLCVNARDAIEGQGHIDVHVGSTRDEVLIEVRDDGCGMDEQQLARAFEPFYTTKASGTGLGLTIVSEILDRAGGRIEVESEPGRGSTFRVRLPRLADA